MSRRVHRGRGPVVVLTYHSIVDTTSDPFEMAVAPDRFAAQVAMLAREFEVISADELRTASKQQRVVITLDDGYCDNLEVAAPIFAAAGVPATFFVNTPRRSSREMWWDEITHALDGSPACEFLEIDVGGRRVAMDVRTPSARAQAVQKVGAHLEVMPAPAIAAVLDSAYEQLGYDPEAVACARHRVLEDHELLELRSLGRFDIGGHTPNHLALTALNDAAAAAEISASFEHLTGLLGTPPTSFAFPFGSVGYAIAAEHAHLVERAGYRQAFNTESSSVSRWFNPYLVPRLHDVHVDADELRSTIARMMGL